MPDKNIGRIFSLLDSFKDGWPVESGGICRVRMRVWKRFLLGVHKGIGMVVRKGNPNSWGGWPVESYFLQKASSSAASEDKSPHIHRLGLQTKDKEIGCHFTRDSTKEFNLRNGPFPLVYYPTRPASQWWDFLLFSLLSTAHLSCFSIEICLKGNPGMNTSSYFFNDVLTWLKNQHLSFF